MENIKITKEERCKNTYIGAPNGEDNQRNGKPTSVTKGIICPNTACVVHNIVKTAETCHHASNTGSQIFVPVDIDAGGISGAGIFAYSAQMQSGAGAVDDESRNECNGDGQIHEETVTQHKLTENTQFARNGQCLLEAVGSGGECQEGHIRTGELNQRTAEEVAEANAKGGYGKTGNVLIRSEGYGKKTEEKSHQKRADQAEECWDQYRKRGIQRGRRGKTLFVKKRADDTAYTANIHDTGNAEVHVAGFLRNDFTGGTIQQGDTLGNGTGEKRKYCFKHNYLWSKSRPTFLCYFFYLYCEWSLGPQKTNIEKDGNTCKRQ